MHDSTEADSVRSHVRELVRTGQYAQARRAAGDALDGPEAQTNSELYVLLGRAHAAEDDDDHDDAAERVYRDGLEAFPDDLDLLAAYAELGAASDPNERPARVRRGRELVERLRNIAPHAPQTQRVLLDAGGVDGTARGPSASRTQRHDARAALTCRSVRVARDKAVALAAAVPHEERLTVLAETLTALALPGRPALRPLLMNPSVSGLVTVVAAGALLLAVPAWDLEPWWVFATLLCAAPNLMLSGLLRSARRRAAARWLPPTGAAARDAVTQLTSVPARSGRERAIAALTVSVVLVAATASAVWSHHRYLDYPRYEVAAPQTFGDLVLLTDTPTSSALAGLMDGNPFPAAQNFHLLYGTEERPLGALVVGAVGDFHNLPYDAIGQLRAGFARGGAGAVESTWRPAPGRYGGSMECMWLNPGDEHPPVVCIWADKGSIGLVLTRPNRSRPSEESITETARDLREAILHRDG
ncbi:serine/threonine-protein kinase [Streptomyces pristinaespiralis]|uniref:hypothetical protein n=1 Tax=Streptomyces pristinaespiralis TaxID=38300 RepID=UPI003833F057